MKPLLYSFSLLLLFLTGACHKKPAVQKEQAATFRVSGYLLGHNSWHTLLDQIDMDKITDLNIAFINPDSTGTFSVNEGLHQVMEAARKKNVRTFMSIGGGLAPAHLGEMISAPHRKQYIAGLLQVCQQFGFDGIDVDLENDLINADYPAFVAELDAALDEKKLLMTAALASWNGHKIADSTLARYDVINIMSYDKTGPWAPTRPGQHSPYEMAEADFRYYHEERGIPAHKLLIGLPFYGYGFGGNAPTSIRYHEIISTYPAAAEKDEINLSDGGTIYYNGRATIGRKVQFALDRKAGGIMIWELKQDSRNEQSLLRLIHDMIRNP